MCFDLVIPFPNIWKKKLKNWESFICKDIHYSIIDNGKDMETIRIS